MDTSEAEGAREAVERDWALETGFERVSETEGLREENERVGWVGEQWSAFVGVIRK
jgi:hypothetical protein